MFSVSSCTSAKTGVAPQWTITFAVAGPRDRGGDHLVARPDAEGDERKMERGRAGRDGEHVFGLEVVAHPRLELGGARARCQPARSQRVRDGGDLLFGDRRGLEREELSSLGGELRHPR